MDSLDAELAERHTDLLTMRHKVSTSNQLLDINVQRFRGGLAFKVHRLLCLSTLGWRAIQKKKKKKKVSLSLTSFWRVFISLRAGTPVQVIRPSTLSVHLRTGYPSIYIRAVTPVQVIRPSKLEQ